MKLEYVTLHLHDELPALGTGFRPALIMRGRKNATIFSPFTLKHVTVPIEAKRAGRLIIRHGLDSLRSEPRPLNARRLHNIASTNRKQREGWGIFDGGNTALKFIEAL